MNIKNLYIDPKTFKFKHVSLFNNIFSLLKNMAERCFKSMIKCISKLHLVHGMTITSKKQLEESNPHRFRIRNIFI